MADFAIERTLLGPHVGRLAGVDEAGRGSLFGPVVAAAVILPSSWMRTRVKGWLREVNDSKLLSASKRAVLAGHILGEAEAVGVGLATNQEIDRKNIYWAALDAMERAIANLPLKPDYLLLDGFRGHHEDFSLPALCVTGGDRKCLSIAAASIVAKVVRDEMMTVYENLFCGYQLAKNKGYGTKEHYRALKQKGPTLLHRLTFNLDHSIEAE
jgi:ribonuclease HII